MSGMRTKGVTIIKTRRHKGPNNLFEGDSKGIGWKRRLQRHQPFDSFDVILEIGVKNDCIP